MYSSTPQFGGEGPGLQPSPAVTADASASPVTAVNNAIGANRMAQASYGGGTSKPSSPKPIDKSNWNRNVKVSQSTVDATKDLGRGNMGIKAAQDAMAVKPRIVGGTLSSGPVAASPEQKEAVSRVYPNAYNQASNKSSSGRSNSPYGFGGYSPRTSIGGGSSASATK
jgi:hypothetical protein